MAWMTSKVPTIWLTKALAAGARWLLGGWPGMFAGLSEQEGCGGKLQEGEKLTCGQIWLRTPALLCTRSHKQLVEQLCGCLRH